MTGFKRDSTLVKAIENHAYPMGGLLREYDPIIEAAKDTQFVLPGEASPHVYSGLSA